MIIDPKIYLGVDNCFASKRWTRPADWMDVIRDLGLIYVEASADTECDPLYMGSSYMTEWIHEVRRQQERTGIIVKNLYSGHGTYSTLGMAHTDVGVRRRFMEQWIKSQAETAHALNSGFGFFAHGIDDSILQNAKAFIDKLEELYTSLAELATYCAEIGLSNVSLEQMYSPQHPPWTISGTHELIRRVWEKSGAAMYITNDVGHMNGQQFFQKPTEEYIHRCVDESKAGKSPRRVWMGTRHAMNIYYEAIKGSIIIDDAVRCIMEDVRQNPHLFAEPEDGNVYNWLEKIGTWTPIVHLQQSDGKSSPHWCFDEKHNAIGIIDGASVIRSIVAAYKAETKANMPSACTEIVFTLEPFIATAGNNYDALKEIADSIDYWRRYIPRDGMRLSEAAAMLK